MRVLVLGGTVFLGRHVVDAALRRGDEVTIVSRGMHGAPPPGGVEWLRGDRATDLPALLGRRTWDAAVDTSGYDPAVVETAARVLADRVEHVSFVSTANAYRDWPAEPVDESSAVWEDGEGYGPGKAGCERALRAVMPGRVALLRCASVRALRRDAAAAVVAVPRRPRW